MTSTHPFNTLSPHAIKAFGIAGESNQAEKVMQLVNTLSAASYLQFMGDIIIPSLFVDHQTYIKNDHTLFPDEERQFRTWFDLHVAGSIPYYVSMLYLKIIAYCHAAGETLYERDYRKESTGSFHHDCLRINHYILCAYHHTTGKDWGYVLAAISAFCQWYHINLQQYMEWVLRDALKQQPSL